MFLESSDNMLLPLIHIKNRRIIIWWQSKIWLSLSGSLLVGFEARIFFNVLPFCLYLTVWREAGVDMQQRSPAGIKQWTLGAHAPLPPLPVFIMKCSSGCVCLKQTFLSGCFIRKQLFNWFSRKCTVSPFINTAMWNDIQTRKRILSIPLQVQS